MFKFITQRSFFVNLLVAIALLVLIIFAFFFSLGSITKHNESVAVPDITGKKLAEAADLLKQKKFQVAVQDSVYIDSIAPLTVVKQSPEGEDVVKTNRTIYLTVNRATPPLIEMPDLRGFSYKSAQMFLESLGLKSGNISYTPDIARNAVKDQLLNGKTVNPGAKVPMSTAIDLVLGNGLGDTQLAVPSLVGLTVSQAKEYLSGDNIGIGVVLTDGAVADTANAYIVRQNPEPTTLLPSGETVNNRIRAGQMMDIWISAVPPGKDSTTPQPAPDNQ
ncbi:PASTA domain-containing protein [Parafilimonas sp.]|uniref:PASTA domain-containing protein n=1 Tax=Parafilimonas sp. TaxID=1969739 RepID=UPI0039E4E764